MNAVRTGITPIAWLIAPSALLFALFFFLPMGLMAIMVLLTISLVLVIAYNRILGLVSGQRDLQ